MAFKTPQPTIKQYCVFQRPALPVMTDNNTDKIL